jgi:hypothetical protein
MGRHFLNRQRVRALSADLTEVHRGSPVPGRSGAVGELQVRQSEGRHAIASIGRPEDENSAWFWAMLMICPLHCAQFVRREAEGQQSDLRKEGFAPFSCSYCVGKTPYSAMM